MKIKRLTCRREVTGAVWYVDNVSGDRYPVSHMEGIDIIHAMNRLCELEEQIERGQLVCLPTKAEEQRFCVERALGIKLYDWQVAYIWNNSLYVMPGRCTGKTVAHIIKLCLSEGDPIRLYDATEYDKVAEKDFPRTPAGFREFLYTFQDIYTRLEMQGGLSLRKIVFSRKSEYEGRKNIEII